MKMINFNLFDRLVTTTVTLDKEGEKKVVSHTTYETQEGREDRKVIVWLQDGKVELRRHYKGFSHAGGEYEETVAYSCPIANLAIRTNPEGIKYPLWEMRK